MNAYYEELKTYIEKSAALGTALSMLHWDNETLAPEEAIKNTSGVLGILSGEYYHTAVNDKVMELLEKLSQPKEQETLDWKEKAIVKNMAKDIEKIKVIPAEEYMEFEALTSEAAAIWAKAKQNDDYASYMPTLDRIIEIQKKFAGYRAKEGQKLYDILLDDYEEGFTTKELDEFFGRIREAVVPLLAKVREKGEVDKSYNERFFASDKQAEFGKFLAEYVGFDFKRGVLAESEHPFTMEFHNHDVRITTHYYENNLESSIFSIIHEAGHALYEMGVSDELTLTPVGSGTSMGMHESQSRFYENMLGRSKAFWTPIWDKLKDTFPESLCDVSLDQFIAGINKAEPGFIRTESDELTYSLHIMVRYEIERMIFNNEIETKDLPKVWNEKYQEYLGMTPPNDRLGILQDLHWSGGSFGYFPSYALGNAVAAQLYHYMNQKMPIEKLLLESDLSSIREFLKENIHKWGKTKTTNEMLMEITGEPLNAEYYITYLTEKYGK